MTEYLDKEAMQLKIEKLYRQIDLALENGDRDAFWNYRMKSTASNSIKKKKSLIKLLKALCEVIKLVEQKEPQERRGLPAPSVRRLQQCAGEIKFLAVFLYN